MLRENMSRSQVEKILQPVKVGPIADYFPVPPYVMYYGLSSESGVWIKYMKETHKPSPEDKLAASGGGLDLGMLDNKTGKWSSVLVPLRK